MDNQWRLKMTKTFTFDIGKGIKIDVDFDRLITNAPEAFVYLVDKGVRNVLGDTHAGETLDKHNVPRDANGKCDTNCPEWHAMINASRDAAMRKLLALYDNDVRTASGPRASSVDPVQAEALRLARVAVAAQARGWEKAGTDGRKVVLGWAKELKLPRNSADELKTVVKTVIESVAASEAFVEKAKRNVAEKAELKVDLSKLLAA
jgi:hypothetical protein